MLDTDLDGFTVRINEFTDMSRDAFRERLGYHSPAPRLVIQSTSTSLAALPEAIDWSQKGAVTGVKNQAQCGSCWAFSATGAMEGRIFIKTGRLESLSEQELVSCDHTDQGCGGGSMEDAFTFAKKNGLALESSYPYVSGDGKSRQCNATRTKPAPYTHPKSFVRVTPSSELDLKRAVSEGPVSVAIEADHMAFQFYNSGIIRATMDCGTQLDHGVLAVGYGEEDGVLYWKIKNSWGKDWGEDGYVRIERTESNHSSGVCGIAMDASYPVV